MTLAYWLNSAWMWKCRIELARFRRATQCVEFSQSTVLQEILKANATSEFGRTHDFSAIRSAAEFQRRVPLSSYGDLGEYIERIGAGEKDVLTSEPVNLLEPTSGSSAAVKLIPYTASLRAQFQRGIDAWLGDLLHAYPTARQGRAYWSISPALGARRTSSGGIPIGFDDDMAYLGKLERSVIRHLLAVPPELVKTKDLDQFRYHTLLHLLAADDLSLISVWSPTFLCALLSQLDERSTELCRDLRTGRLLHRSRRSAQRADDLAKIFNSAIPMADKLRRVWPRLALISCWADGASARYLGEITALFPNVAVQPKGLLATEGFISFPLAWRAGAALALRSHFFEFIDARNDLRLGHQLESGKSYQIVITTGGGLYRYRLGDMIEVIGFEHHCPLLRFAGRADGVCDLVGEKVSENLVRAALERSFSENEIALQFAMMVPIEEGQRRYRLYVQRRNGELSLAKLGILRARVEELLEENPYYAHAVRIGQLGKLQVHALSSQAEPAWAVYERECLRRGQKLGDIKPVVLHSGREWVQCFEPLTETRAWE